MELMHLINQALNFVIKKAPMTRWTGWVIYICTRHGMQGPGSNLGSRKAWSSLLNFNEAKENEFEICINTKNQKNM